MDGNTFIGFSHEHSKAYCPHCDYIYEYSWNGCKPLSENKTCPECGNHDDVVSENFIETSISMSRMTSHHEDLTDEERKYYRKKISDLNAIRRKFDEYDKRKENHH
jgi:predicted RNA-binding Zn-ribbon protein involved in translation (DUF1610 family)